MKKRCEVIPLPDHQFQFLIDGQEKTRWHFGDAYPRPFFFPMNCVSGESLTRMGHPGAPNHDHHRSVWFAHHKVFGHNFWGDGTGTRIRQSEWLAIEENDEWARFGCQLNWLDGHDPTPLMDQQLLVEIKPGDGQAWTLELQSTFTPHAAELELQQTNFGFLAVRVSRQIAEYWGGGKLTNSHLVQGEKDIFGEPSKWMDYSGQQYSQRERQEVAEGVTYIDHADNIGQPTRWHVREDGWMGASPGMQAAINLKKDAPLTLRYLLHIHPGPVDPRIANQLYADFAASEKLAVQRSQKKHTHWEIVRQA